jgi:hypothetical protein
VNVVKIIKEVPCKKMRHDTACTDSDFKCIVASKVSRRVSVIFRSIALALCLQVPILCYALDVDPGDYTPLPDGTKLGLLYLQHAERNDLYVDNDKVSSKSKLDSDIAIFRAVSYQDFAGLLTNIQLLLPFGHLSAGGDIGALGSETGMGDPILANAIWLDQDPSTQRAFGLTQYLFLPLGDYSKNNDLNIGENRWKYVLQAGYTQGITDKIILDLVADVTFFGENDSYTSRDLTLKQDNQYQAQGYLRYMLSEKLSAHIGYSRSWGGETEVEGVSQKDEGNQQKVMLGGSYFITPKTQILATFGRDVSVDNGFKEDSRLNLRFLYLF